MGSGEGGGARGTIDSNLCLLGLVWATSHTHTEHIVFTNRGLRLLIVRTTCVGLSGQYNALIDPHLRPGSTGTGKTSTTITVTFPSPLFPSKLSAHSQCREASLPSQGLPTRPDRAFRTKPLQDSPTQPDGCNNQPWPQQQPRSSMGSCTSLSTSRFLSSIHNDRSERSTLYVCVFFVFVWVCACFWPPRDRSETETSRTFSTRADQSQE